MVITVINPVLRPDEGSYFQNTGTAVHHPGVPSLRLFRPHNFYYNSCILHIVSRSKGDHIRPPDIGIEIRNTGAIIPFYISSISIWNWGGKIIQIKDGSVNHRIYPHICKKTIGCSKKASESFFIKPKIIYYKLSVP